MGKVQRLTNEQVKQALKSNELQDFLEDASDWVRSHLENVIIGAVLAAVLAFGVYYLLSSRHESSLKASMQLASAENQFQRALSAGDPQAYAAAAAAYQGIKAEFGGRQEAVLAELGIANVDFQTGKFEEARQGYERFVATYASSPLAPLALAGQAASLEALGKSLEAADLYLSLNQKYPDASNAALSLVDAARAYEKLGQKERLKEIVAALEKLDAEKRLPQSLKSRLTALRKRV